MHFRGLRFRSLIALPLALAVVCGGPPARAIAGDPVLPLLHRMNRFLHRNETGGVTLDPRWPLNPPEVFRQSLVCQILGYAELYEIRPSRKLERDIRDRADFLVGVLDQINTHAPFDGMLAHSLLAAYQVTGDPRHLAGAETVVRDLMAIPTWQCVLNGGLMVAMAVAQYDLLTGDPSAEEKAREIVASLPGYQNADGSFPHWCYGSSDIHYTGWMSMELIHLERMLGDAAIDPMLRGTLAFLEGRVDSTGRSRYEEPCPESPGCVRYYYSRASGCWYDYDTRGWTVEPGYLALLFDSRGSPEYLPVMQFLESLENGGAFPDLYGYWPPPEDPEYPWTVADTSVQNTSVLFWTLATILTGRMAAGAPRAEWDWIDDEGDDPPEPPVAVAPALGLGPIVPNPAGRDCTIRLALPAPSPVTLEIVDAAGRRIRGLVAQVLEAGPYAVPWDRRDGMGNPVPSGVYFVRLDAGGRVRVTRALVLR